ncbi:MAG: AMP-binding protein [Flavobacteriia bacterium]|nr:AMP-binding protein [Flavobacteriia bacterium]
MLNVSSLSFDFASFDEYLLLGLGATLISVTTDDIKDSNVLIEKTISEKVTVWISTPSLVYLYLTEPRFNSEYLPDIHTFVFAGEALPLRTFQQLRVRFPKAKIWNAFGPSEATNLTTSIELTDEIIEKYNAIPIGFPKPNSEVFIHEPDEEGLGEICIVGNHLSPGYLNNEILNREKFALLNGKRTYFSGDQGYSQNNLLFYAGRNDDMVKLHGYRIELDDISSVLQDFTEINNATTIGLKNKGETKKIISFYTAEINLEKQIIINFLREKLPEYMIPSDIIFLKEIPLNTSGKVDKKRLQEIYTKKEYELNL